MPRTQITLFVHSCSESRFPARATIAGQEVDVEVPGLVVELVSEDSSMSQTLRLTPADAAAFEGAEEGDQVVVTYDRTAATPVA